MIKRSLDPGFGIALQQKDVNRASSSARKLGVKLANTATCQELFNAAVAHGGAAWHPFDDGARAGDAGQSRDGPQPTPVRGGGLAGWKARGLSARE